MYSLPYSSDDSSCVQAEFPASRESLTEVRGLATNPFGVIVEPEMTNENGQQSPLQRFARIVKRTSTAPPLNEVA